MLDVLRIPVIRMAGHEADDAIGTLAIQASDAGLDAVIVTADRDFFQLVRDRVQGRGAISVLFNRRGISEIDRMDPAAVEAATASRPSSTSTSWRSRATPPTTSRGSPGSATRPRPSSCNTFGSVEELLARTDELKGKQKENIVAAADRLALNKQLARIVTDVELDLSPEDCVMGAYDPEQVRSLFVSLEFRSLARSAGRGDGHREADGRGRRARSAAGLRRGSSSRRFTGGAAAVALRVDDGAIRGAAVSAGGAQASYADLDDARPAAGGAGRRGGRRSRRTTRRRSSASLTARGPGLDGVTFDTLIGGYLLDPGTTEYSLEQA